MIELVITNRLHAGICNGKDQARFITLRRLSKKEIDAARKSGIKRFYLASFSMHELEVFLEEFDRFWDQVIGSFGADHPFWRNVVSSKMQEWERSGAYLALILFSLSQESSDGVDVIVVVCSSLEEEKVCERLGKKMGWRVHRKPYLSMPMWFRRVWQEIRNIGNFTYMIAVCLYKKLFSPRYKPHGIKEEERILIVSLLYYNSFSNGEYQDPFFGSIHNVIRKDGKRVIYLCDILDNFRRSARKIKESREVPIAVPYGILTWREIFLLLLRVFMKRVRFNQVEFIGCDFSDVLQWNSRRFEYPFNLHSEIYYAAVKKVCKKENFMKLMLLYEGNVFERASIQAFKNYCSGEIVGYSHAVVFPLNLKIRLTDKEKTQRPEPDSLISTGLKTKELMAEIGNRDLATIHAGCSLRFIPIVSERRKGARNEGIILVALDGVWLSFSLIEWLAKNSMILKDYKVKLRGHPNVPVRKLLEQCIYDIPENFVMSNNNLEEDIVNAFCVIYRHTSVGMQALMNGVPAIHADIDSPMPCDPIVDLTACKWTVRSAEGLRTVLKAIESLESDTERVDMAIARKYVDEYFAAPDVESIWGYISKNKSNNVEKRVV
jgi:hypothetical protein